MWQSVLKRTKTLIKKPFVKALIKYVNTLDPGTEKTILQVQKEVAPFYKSELKENSDSRGASQKVNAYLKRDYSKAIGGYLRKIDNVDVFTTGRPSRTFSMKVVE